MSPGRGSGQKERVRSQEIACSPATRFVDGAELHRVAFTVKEHCRPASRTAKCPLFDYSLVVNGEAVLVHHTREHDVNCKSRGLAGRLLIEAKWPTRDPATGFTGAERVQDVLAHVIHGLKQIALARCVCTEESCCRQNSHRRSPFAPWDLAHVLIFGHCRRDQRELKFIPKRTHILGPETQ